MPSSSPECRSKRNSPLAEELLSRGLVHYRAEEAGVRGAKATLAEVNGEQLISAKGLRRSSGDLRGARDGSRSSARPTRTRPMFARARGDLGRNREAAGTRALWEDMKAAPRVADVDNLLTTIA